MARKIEKLHGIYRPVQAVIVKFKGLLGGNKTKRTSASDSCTVIKENSKTIWIEAPSGKKIKIKRSRIIS